MRFGDYTLVIYEEEADCFMFTKQYSFIAEGVYNMLFPDEKVICEIPIYSMPEAEFNRKWEKQKKKWIDESIGMGNSESRAREIINKCYYPQYLWKYNQIVGFVEIAISPRDVSFNVQKTLDKRFFIISKTKHFIQDLRTGGMHFPICKMSNEEILTEIEEYLLIVK